MRSSFTYSNNTRSSWFKRSIGRASRSHLSGQVMEWISVSLAVFLVGELLCGVDVYLRRATSAVFIPGICWVEAVVSLIFIWIIVEMVIRTVKRLI